MVQWAIGSIPPGEYTELFLVPVSNPQLVTKAMVCDCLVCVMVDIKKSLTANQIK